MLLLRAASAAVEAQVVRATQHAAATVWRPTGVPRPTYHGASNPTLTPALPRPNPILTTLPLPPTRYNGAYRPSELPEGVECVLPPPKAQGVAAALAAEAAAAESLALARASAAAMPRLVTPTLTPTLTLALALTLT